MPVSIRAALSAQKVNPEKPVRFVAEPLLISCDRYPVFSVKFAGRGNPAFLSRLAVMQEEMRVHASGPSTDAKETANLENWARILAATVIVGWENVCGPDGAQLPFDVEQCESVLLELATEQPETLRRLAVFVQSPDYFRGAPAALGGALGKP